MGTIDRRLLKAYVRYDGSGKVIPGSNILQKKMPKVGTWSEIDAYECCNPGSRVVSGEWTLIDEYRPAFTDGEIVFPNHLIADITLDPNDVGVGLTMLYINIDNGAGTAQSAIEELVGRSGTITLTQGANSVTYTFTSGAFLTGGYGNTVYYDWLFAASTAGALVVTTPSAGDFDTTTAITITMG